MANRYRYLALPLEQVINLISSDLVLLPDAYRSANLADLDLPRFQALLDSGARWVHTEDDWAIFEIPVEEPVWPDPRLPG